MGTYRRCRILLTIAWSFVPLAVFAQGKPRIISEVRIEGEKRIPEETIRLHIFSKPGQELDRAVVAKDIQNLFKLGGIDEVEVETQEGQAGLTLIYKIEEKPIITKVIFEGNKKVRSKELEEEVKLGLYQPMDEKKLAETFEAIQKIYTKKGYYLVEIDKELRTTSEGDTELVLKIMERERATIRKVHFVGNRVFTDKELRKVIQTKRHDTFSFVTGRGKYKEELLDQDVMRLTFYYLKHGYLKVKVFVPDVTLSRDKRYFFVSFKMEEGDRYHVSSVRLSGDILTTSEELMRKIQTRGGQIYNREFVEQDIELLSHLYGDQGYAYVHVSPLTTTDEVAKTAAIDFRIEKGPRVKIERIEISGNQVTRDKVIRRELRIQEGDLYNESAIAESQRRLLALGFFKKVDFAKPRGSRDDTIQLTIDVEEQHTGTFNIGAGFSTAEDFIFTASIAKNNFFGYGWAGQVSVEVSGRRQQYVLNMTDPYFLDTGWSLGVSGYRTTIRYVDFDRGSFGGGLTVGHRLFKNMSVALGYEAEQVKITGIAAVVPDIFRQNVSGLTSMVSLTVDRDTRNNRIFTTKGMYHSARVELSGDKLGGDNDFFRTIGRAQFYQPVVWGIVFKTYGRVGYIKSLSSQRIPLFERFYLGGVNSLRGFLPQSVGPKMQVVTSGKETDFVFGGNKMFLMNTEFEFPLYDPAGFRAVAFFDAGQAFSEDENYSVLRLRSNYGFGLRWISPMGPLRFEWGIPVNPRPGEDDLVFNFTIGSFF